MLGSARQQVCSQAHGRVLEVAIGTVRNLPFYPAEAALTGIDLSAVMLDAASARAKKLGIDINLCLADAQALPFPDACFDTVVCTFGLSSIPDDNTAVRPDVPGSAPRRPATTTRPHRQPVPAGAPRTVRGAAVLPAHHGGSAASPDAAAGRGRRVPRRPPHPAPGRHHRTPRRQQTNPDRPASPDPPAATLGPPSCPICGQRPAPPYRSSAAATR